MGQGVLSRVGGPPGDARAGAQQAPQHKALPGARARGQGEGQDHPSWTNRNRVLGSAGCHRPEGRSRPAPPGARSPPGRARPGPPGGRRTGLSCARRPGRSRPGPRRAGWAGQTLGSGRSRLIGLEKPALWIESAATAAAAAAGGGRVTCAAALARPPASGPLRAATASEALCGGGQRHRGLVRHGGGDRLGRLGASAPSGAVRKRRRNDLGATEPTGDRGAVRRRRGRRPRGPAVPGCSSTSVGGAAARWCRGRRGRRGRVDRRRRVRPAAVVHAGCVGSPASPDRGRAPRGGLPWPPGSRRPRPSPAPGDGGVSAIARAGTSERQQHAESIVRSQMRRRSSGVTREARHLIDQSLQGSLTGRKCL